MYIDSKRRIHKKWVIVFGFAVLVRGLFFLQVIEQPSVMFQPDSRMYVRLAEGIRQHGTLSDPLQPENRNVERMPGYPVFLAVLLSLSGGSFLFVVAFQAVLDSASCVLVGLLGEHARNGVGLPAGLLAALNPNMLTYSLFVLTDSLFLLIFLIALWGVVRFMESPDWRWGLFSGGLLGFGTLIRPVLAYFPIFLLPFLLVYMVRGKGVSLFRAAGLSLVVACMFAGSLTPWLLRNQAVGGRFQLTSQGGEYLVQYVVPFVWQYSKGIPFIEGMKIVNTKMKLEAKKEGKEWDHLSPFEQSERNVDMALEILSQEPPSAIAKAWAFGMVKNLFAPAAVDMSYLLAVERPHFFYTEGRNLFDRGYRFVRGMSGWFGWVVLVSLALMPLIRLMQTWGLICVLKERVWIGILFLTTIVYFLLVSGPVGYAKYRIPFEPILIVLLAVSAKDLFQRFQKKRMFSREGEPR